MRRNSWCGLIIAALSFLLLPSGRAADTSLSETNLIPKDDLRLWTESMLWDGQVSAESGVGYKDNVLLSAFNPHGSTFCENGLEAMAMRLPLDGWSIVGFITGNDIRFTDIIEQ